MIRTMCAVLLVSALTANPCFAQLTPDQVEKRAAVERQQMLRSVEGLKERIARAEVGGNLSLATETAVLLAHAYEQPNVFDHKPLDPVQARRWYGYAAAKGSTNAGYWLGMMHWDGRGGPEDRERAKYIWMWAAEHKDVMAAMKLQQLRYDAQKERELAFGQAKAYQSQAKSQSEKAEEGLAIVFGLLLLSALAKDDCEPYRRAQLVGSPLPGPIPAHCQ